jgi:nicotinate (nicotinamide) nucleotide adenylyltransferase
MEIVWRPEPDLRPSRLVILAAAFNPVTRAHVALLDAARPHTDETLCVIPRTYPHKEWHGATLDQRIAWLRALAPTHRFAIAISEGGLFADIVAEAESCYDSPEIGILCGRDAAERMIHWDYGRPGAIEDMLARFRLLVVERQGRLEPPDHLSDRITHVDISQPLDEVSSSEVRRRIVAGEPWRDLVPSAIADSVGEVYGERKP